MKIIALLLLLVVPALSGERLRLLMIGNSYTAQTRKAVQGMLEADPELELEFATHAPGGRFFEQHAKDPKVVKLLEREWDVVVLQEQSQLPAFAMNGDPGSRKRFEDGGMALIEMVRGAPGEPRILLFQTWARHGGDDKRGTLRKHFDGKPGKMMDALAKGYRLLAKKAGGDVEVVEVGRAFEGWYEAKGYDEKRFSLHRPDASHPSAAGALLTGAVFYRALTGRDPVETDYRGGIEAELAKELLAAGE